MVEVVKQSLEPGVTMVNFGFDDVEMKLLALFQDEHIIGQNNSIFIEAMKSFESG